MSELKITTSSILIVDDQEQNIRLLEFMLEAAGHSDVRGISDPRRALAACTDRRPDLILLDLQMPQLGGLDLMKLLLQEFSDEVYFPILILTGDLSPEATQQALSAGAKDFLRKPFNSAELLLRIHSLLETRALYKQVEEHNYTLTARVEERTHELAEARIEILQRLALAAEYRDDETGQHTQRVGMLASMLAQAIDRPAEEIDLLRLAAPLHDVGKIGIPDLILLKPGKLSIDEFTVMKSHTLIGGQILAGSRFSILQIAQQIALSHHERWDGMGYPHGLSGERIPLAARITAIADVFDALTHARPYKAAWTLDRALEMIKQERDRHFDPALASAFLSIVAGDGLQKLATQVNVETRSGSRVESVDLESVR
jgi:putative two-component system response regulator